MPARQCGSSSCAASTGVMPSVSRSVRPSAASVRSTRSPAGTSPPTTGRATPRPPATGRGWRATAGGSAGPGRTSPGPWPRPDASVTVHRGLTARATRSRLASMSARPKCEVVDGDAPRRRRRGRRPRFAGERAVDLGVDERPAVLGVERAQPRAVVHAGHQRRPSKPASTSSSVSSAAFSSRVWNGLSGVSRPGEKVIRFGVLTSSSPPGRRTRAHSAGTVPGPRGAR